MCTSYIPDDMRGYIVTFDIGFVTCENLDVMCVGVVDVSICCGCLNVGYVSC